MADNAIGIDGALFDATAYRDAGLPKTLRERFVVPPLSVLDQRAGYWQDRKRAWLGLGIKSEEGRGDHMAYKGQVTLKAIQTTGTSADASEDDAGTGTSVFDPVTCELAYRWFCPSGGSVLDPFAGGSVRGIVAAALGRTYTGIDLSARQIAANDSQWDEIGATVQGPTPTWFVGDSRQIDGLLPSDYRADMVFSCPPYADLEVYSDDPADLSTMAYPDFVAAYRDIIAAAVRRMRPDRFAVWVIGEVRSRAAGGPYIGLVPDTISAFRDAGASFYNELITVSPVGSLPVRVGRQFVASRKIGKSHQQVLVFVKGDPRKASAACEAQATAADGVRSGLPA